MLRHLLQLAAQALGGSPPQQVVITVPAYFGPQQRAATLQAAQLAGIQQVCEAATSAVLCVSYQVARNCCYNSQQHTDSRCHAAGSAAGRYPAGVWGCTVQQKRVELQK